MSLSPGRITRSRSGSIRRPSRPRRPAYAAHVDQMVRQLLLTTPGERVNLPAVRLRAAVPGVRPGHDALAATVQLRVIQGLSQWLAGVVTVVDVVGGREPTARPRAGHAGGDGHLHPGGDRRRPRP